MFEFIFFGLLLILGIPAIIFIVMLYRAEEKTNKDRFAFEEAKPNLLDANIQNIFISSLPQDFPQITQNQVALCEKYKDHSEPFQSILNVGRWFEQYNINGIVSYFAMYRQRRSSIIIFEFDDPKNIILFKMAFSNVITYDMKVEDDRLRNEFEIKEYERKQNSYHGAYGVYKSMLYAKNLRNIDPT